MNNRLSIREQYNLADRMFRMNLFDNLNTFASEKYAQSFGISPKVLHNVFLQLAQIEFHGWVNTDRFFAWVDRRMFRPIDRQIAQMPPFELPEWLLELSPLCACGRDTVMIGSDHCAFCDYDAAGETQPFETLVIPPTDARPPLFGFGE